MRSIFAMACVAWLGGGLATDVADPPADLARWERVVPPERRADYWLQANNDVAHDWVVFLDGDRPSARLWAPKRTAYPDRQESYPPLPFAIEEGPSEEGLAGEWFAAKVVDGWIIGFNKGEWGGALWWFSPDGTTRSRISRDQIIGFVETDVGLLALEGIAHGSLSRGQVLRLVRGEDGRWHSEKFVDLEGAPEAAVKRPDGTLLVATHDRLVRVHLDSRKVEPLVKEAFWGLLYPKTMACTRAGIVYLGMRHGVAEIDLSEKAPLVRWLIPDAEIDREFEREAQKFK